MPVTYWAPNQAAIAQVEIKYKTGVYQIINTINGKVYIGSGAGRSGISVRWNQHKSKLRRQEHANEHLQSAWNKYGESSFIFKILIRCPADRCLKWEQFFINKFRSYERELGYNISPIAISQLGFKHSEESKRKMSELKIGNKNALGGKGFRGGKHSEETKRKMSEARKGRVINQEWRNNLSKSLKGKPKKRKFSL